jgi:hypothetical protein
MTEKRFNLINNITGILVFIIAAFTYLSTIEPTVPLWDCGEFIAGSYKLEVVHPPGAPFFLMFNHLFTMFTHNPQAVPVIVNGLSGIESALTILFLFWTITLLGRKFFLKQINESKAGEVIAVMGAGVVGALAYNFSDSFWFSAVEGEVYALSSFFIALVFWLLLKWERRADEPHHLRWLILIAYMMGLSTGVHLLSLLAIPVVAFVYYFRKFEKITWKGIIVAGIVGFVILGIINIVVIRWLPFIASRFELLFVNIFHLPFWSGVFFAMIIIFGLIIYGIYYTYKKGKVVFNTALISLAMVIIGFCSYTMVPIRSNDNPPIDYSNPDDIFNLMSYLNREQYGDRPLLWGPQFTAEVIDVKQGRMMYLQDKENKVYKAIGHKNEPVYDPKQFSLFPRMGDNRSDRKQAYKSWVGMKKSQKKPTFAQNIKFFVNYQMGLMYWRYFAWNFIGRQNDEQGNGDVVPSGYMSGNWISGIKFIDEPRVGKQEKLPYSQRVNKAENKMYFLPFIMGLIGLLFHFKKHKRDAFSVFMLFLTTGALLIVYQNSPPFEPRERDYVCVGSFYVYAIWIGFGVLAIFNYLREKVKQLPLIITSLLVTIISIFVVPVLMASQEWNDHDRSHRYTSRDFGYNYLVSCDSNALLFTNGDNDTYPLWYNQEVEGARDDVRVINLQLLMTDWYVEQLRNQCNHSTPVKFSITQDKIPEGTRDYLGYYDNPSLGIDKNAFYDLSEILDFVSSDNPKYQATSSYSGAPVNYLPTKKFKVPVDTLKVIKNGTVRKDLANRVVKSVMWDINDNSIYKNSLMQLDMIANNNWNRPICWAITSGNETFLNLNKYFQQAGMIYRLVPVLSQQDEEERGEVGRVDPVIMYDNMMNKFKWGNLSDSNIYIDGVTRRHLNNYRNVFATLGKALLKTGDKAKTIKVVDKCLEVLPEHHIPHQINSLQLAQLYYLADAKDKGEKFSRRLAAIFIEELEYFSSLKQNFIKSAEDDIQRDIYGLQVIENMTRSNGQVKFADEVKTSLTKYQSKFGF